MSISTVPVYYATVLGTVTLVVLAEEVDEGDERVGELDGVLPCLLEAVRAQRDQNPNAMVELVLAVDVDAEPT